MAFQGSETIFHRHQDEFNVQEKLQGTEIGAHIGKRSQSFIWQTHQQTMYQRPRIYAHGRTPL